MSEAKEDDVRFSDVTVLKSTDKAILVEIDGKQHWIPQSVVSDDSEVWEEGDEGDLVLAGWFARREGLE